jgi:putative ABC transport system permease protein
MLSDLRYAIRSFLKSPAFSIVVILTLALGVGANTAIFTVVNAVLLRPLPYPDPDALLRVRRGTSFPDMRDWQQETRSFVAIGGFRPQFFDYSNGADPERLDGALVTGQLLGVLGAKPGLGRLIGPDDDRRGTQRVAMVSDGFWRTRLGSAPDVVGRALMFNAITYTVIGVLAPGFELPATKADVYAPFLPQVGREADSRGAHTLRAIVRLKSGVTLPQAQQDMDALAVRLEQQYPDTNREIRFRLQRLDENIVGTIRPALVMLVATVGFVLLIACVNVANLLIARGASRRGELAVRAALGAGRSRLARQLLTESVLLAVTGGAVGLVLAWWITRAVIGLAPAGVPRLETAALDLRVLGFTALISLVTGLVFGLLPAWTAASTPLVEVSRGSGRTTGGGGRLRATLMVAEIALALVLVVGAGLLLRSFLALTQQPIGFATSHLLTANVTLSSQRYFDIPTRTQLFEAYEDALASLPGVRNVALTTDLPVGGSPIFHNLAFDGRPMEPGTEPEVYYRGVGVGYLETLGIPLRRGRAFTRDDKAGAPLVAIVNEAFVRQYYPGEDALGQRVRWVSGDPAAWITIVGVVADVRGLSLDQAEVPAMHVPYRQEASPWRMWMDVAVRTDRDAASLAPMLRSELARLDRTVPLTRIRTMDQVLETSVADRRFNLYLLGGFAVLALLLAAAGTYGVMAYAVSQRTRELGVRMALGARPADVFRLIVGRGVALAVLGIVLGLAASLALARTVADLLFEVSPHDTTTFAAAAIVLLASAVMATWFPARRAARVDPLVALRSE